MGAILRVIQKKQGYFHSWCLKFVRFSPIKTQDLETKNQKNQQLEWLYSMSWNAMQFTRLSLVSVATIQVPLKTTISAQIIWCKQVVISVELWFCIFLSTFLKTSPTSLWKIFLTSTITLKCCMTQVNSWKKKSAKKMLTWVYIWTKSTNSIWKENKYWQNTSEKVCWQFWGRLLKYFQMEIPTVVWDQSRLHLRTT